jgi:predicted nucleic acid-binding protein
MQYTIRNIPPALDEALRRKAERERKSLNEVAVELLAQALGVGAPAPRRRDLGDVAGLLLKLSVRAIYPDDTTTRLYAGVYRQLRSQGTPIPTNDMWIAAVAMQHDLMVYSRDRHFQHLPQLVLL